MGWVIAPRYHDQTGRWMYSRLFHRYVSKRSRRNPEIMDNTVVLGIRFAAQRLDYDIKVKHGG